MYGLILVYDYFNMRSKGHITCGKVESDVYHYWIVYLFLYNLNFEIKIKIYDNDDDYDLGEVWIEQQELR